MVVEALASRLQASPWAHEKRWDCELSKFDGGWLLKPHTFMNASGEAVAAVCRFFKIEPQEILAVYDDVDLPVGAMRFRTSGSAAGHNGVRSLINHLGGEAFPRLKVGIAPADGRPGGEKMVGHVLGRFSEPEKSLVQNVIGRAVDAVQAALRSGLESAMNLYNRKEPNNIQNSQQP
jgi:PTH1 family peptidyl-tRNA hydrolase